MRKSLDTAHIRIYYYNSYYNNYRFIGKGKKDMSILFSSPGKYIQGSGEMANIGKYTGEYGTKQFMILSRSCYDRFADILNASMEVHGVETEYAMFNGECTYGEMKRIADICRRSGSHIVVGVGGKALDAAKGVASYCGLPLAMVPTSAAQDAPCSRLSVVYNDEHEVVDFMTHRENPNLVIVDSRVISEAPARLLAAGMGDGISTRFESRACIAKDVANYGDGKISRTAEALALLCYDIIIRSGREAYIAVENNVVTKALEDVIEASIYLSGVGAEGAGDAGAHGLHDALTIFPECRAYMHGELVSFGTLVQLVLENESKGQINELLGFNCAVGLPVCLADIGLDRNDKEKLDRAAQAALEASFTNLPFEVTKESIYAAIIMADVIGAEYKKNILIKGRHDDIVIP